MKRLKTIRPGGMETIFIALKMITKGSIVFELHYALLQSSHRLFLRTGGGTKINLLLFKQA